VFGEGRNHPVEKDYQGVSDYDNDSDGEYNDDYHGDYNVIYEGKDKNDSEFE